MGCSLVTLDLMNREEIDPKGKKIFEEINESKKIFFEDLGVLRINNECNRLRNDFLQAVKQDHVFGFDYEAQQFLDELKVPYDLKEPEKIEVELLNTELAFPCMETHYYGTLSSLSFKIRVYLARFKEEDKEFVWDSYFGYYRFSTDNGCITRALKGKKFTVKTVAFHEFLHACGEIPEFGHKKNDIRNNVIGLNAILGLLERASNNV